MFNKKFSLILLVLSFFVIIGSVSASEDTNQVVGIVTDNGTVPFNYTEPGYCGGCGNITPTLGPENIVPMENNTTNHNNSVHTGNEIVCEECNSSRPMTHIVYDVVYDNNTNTIIFHCFDEMGNKVINQLINVTIDGHEYNLFVDKHGVAILENSYPTGAYAVIVKVNDYRPFALVLFLDIIL